MLQNPFRKKGWIWESAKMLSWMPRAPMMELLASKGSSPAAGNLIQVFIFWEFV